MHRSPQGPESTPRDAEAPEDYVPPCVEDLPAHDGPTATATGTTLIQE